MIDGNIDNLILATDSYKLNHWNQYPKGTEAVYSYFESRDGAEFPYTVFFGLQYILKRYLEGYVVTDRDIVEANKLSYAHFGGSGLFNYNGWHHIYKDHKGQLPIRIKAVPEGMAIPTGNVLMTVENTCPKCYWLTNALESLLVHTWYPSTVATLSHHTFDMIGSFLRETADSTDGLPFMLHDFGYRGASGHETAAIGGAAHLVNGLGTDTLPGMLLAMKYYGADLKNLAFSVPATEHSVMTAREREGEFEVVDQLLDEYPTGILSCVADSYDVMNFVQQIGTTFKDRILARDGKFVVRPDSVRDGDDTPAIQMADLSDALWDHFGGTTNSKGYKVLDPHVGLLWGDGIDPIGITKILTICKMRGYSAENYVFGMGGGLLQKVNRDTQRFAFKCSAQKRDGEWHDVHKGTNGKTSKAGRLKLVEDHGEIRTMREDETTAPDGLQTVFENGKIVREYSFDEIRANAKL